MGTTAVDGLVFDLDNTLLDRAAAFSGVATTFYDEHLCTAASVTREYAVVTMVHSDGDGYTNREAMLRRWPGEWPDAGLDMVSLTEWYRATMEQQVEPNAEVNEFLAELNDRRLP